MTKAKFEEIKRKYSTLLILDTDAEEAMNFVYDVLTAEADATKAKEPTATASIDRLNEAAYEVFSLCNEIGNEEFNED